MEVFGHLKMYSPCLSPIEDMFQASSETNVIWTHGKDQRTVGKWGMVMHPLGNVQNMIFDDVLGGIWTFKDVHPLFMSYRGYVPSLK